jgi:hypothetical protein
VTGRHPVWVLLDKLQMDNRAMAAKIADLRMHVAALDLPEYETFACPTCGITFRLSILRDEHIYNSHHGAVPPHYLRAEQLAGITDQP